MNYDSASEFPGFSDLEQLPAGRRPAVFMFQPNGFEAVTPDRLLEWEQTLVDRFDLPRLNFDDDDDVLRGATWSNSGGRGEICADDSDYHFADDGQSSTSEQGTDSRKPAIFMWQPSRFHVVPSERLAEWERVLRSRVGLPTEGIAADEAGSGTLSATLPNDCMDDSDFHKA